MFLTNQDLNNKQRFTLGAEERLKSKLILASLFDKGSLFISKPLLIKFLFEPSTTLQIQAAFSVPKRRFKLAHDRNYLKRRIREAHRLHLPTLKAQLAETPVRLSVIYIYNSSSLSDFCKIEAALLPFLEVLPSKVH